MVRRTALEDLYKQLKQVTTYYRIWASSEKSSGPFDEISQPRVATSRVTGEPDGW